MSESARLVQLMSWLDTSVYPEQEYKLTPLSGDASFRRYLRLEVEDNNYMVMDAPPEKEKVDEFLEVAEFLAKHDVRVPKIIAKDAPNGFIVLEDFGDELLSTQLNNDTVDALYQQAMKQIVQFLKIPKEELNFPAYDTALLETEMNLFTEWFLPHLNIELTDDKKALWEDTKKTVLGAVANQPQGFVHRDFHSRNLMVLADDDEYGVIDFQDAVVGAYTYDLVSILRDVYVNWSKEQVDTWVAYSYELLKGANIATPATVADFGKEFDMMGVQRHLKILGIFIRLYKRDGKDGYLPSLPQTMHYLLDECATLPEIAEFNTWLCKDILPVFIAENEAERGYLSSYVQS